MPYQPRILDKILPDTLKQHGAVLITGSNSCGKSSTAINAAKSIIDFRDEGLRENYLSVAETMPSKLLIGDHPRAFLDWQYAPDLWDSLFEYFNFSPYMGQFILTGSEPWDADYGHGGVHSISSLTMYPMSLFESGESTGEISLLDLFNGKAFENVESSFSIDDMILSICRGGWPEIITQLAGKSDEDNSSVIEVILSNSRSILDRICQKDVSTVSHVKRKPAWAEQLLISYSKSLCTSAEIKTIFEDLHAQTGMTKPTFYEYFYDLQELFIIDEIPAWCPPIRAKGAVRAGNKRNLVDPSIAVAALGLRPEYFNIDFKTLGQLFQCLCARDLKVYSTTMNGQLSYYQDRYGLNADGVLHLRDGRYALFDFKLGGERELNAAASDLCKIEHLIEEHNSDPHNLKIRLPELKIILTAKGSGYRRNDGVYVLPLACLKD